MPDIEQINNIGLEIELQNTFISNELKNKINKIGFSVIHDASVKSIYPTLGDIPLYKFSEEDGDIFSVLELKEFGGELISRIIDTTSDNFMLALERLCNLLTVEGSYSPRASIHVHINVGHARLFSIYTLKSMIRWMTRMESTFFRIGSFGQIHRGIENNYNYCRPICLKGPLIVQTPKGFGQIFSTKDLIEAKVSNEFWNRYGDCNNFADRKYHPVRYHGFNLLSLFKYGTLEYRFANLILNPLKIISYILLCQATTFMMLNTSYKELNDLNVEPINSIFYPYESDSRKILNYVLDNYEETPKNIKNELFDIYDQGIFPRISDDYVKTHMIRKEVLTYFSDTEYVPEKIDSKLILEPIFMDIHQKEAKKEKPDVYFNTLK